jgi:CRISPR/Cas system-associated exonuclease Cas4 (RecB family)
VSDRRVSYKPTGEVLLHLLRRHVMREAARPTDRDMTFVHPSEMTKDSWCPRVPYYRIAGVPSEPEEISFSLANIFAEGHSIHDKYQQWFWDMGVLWGRWKCNDCGDSFFATSPKACNCGGSLRYREVPLFSEEHHLIGHADGAVVCEDGKIRLIEIKTVGLGTVRIEAPALFRQYADGSKPLDKLWMSVNRPFPSHLKQGNLYLHMAPKCHEFLADTDEMIFIYEWKPTQAVREFVVGYSPSVVQSLLDDAKAIKASLSTGVAPDRPHWSAAGAKVCRKCVFSATCWEQEEEEKDVAPTVRVRRATSTRRRKALGSS